jgi:putative zinc finger protein
MVIRCEEVWLQVSNYIDGEIAPPLRASMDEHLHGCQRCRAVLDGTRNIVEIYGDERMVQVPLGFSSRLHRKIEQNMPRRRSVAWGWMVAVAAAAMVLGIFEVGDTSPANHELSRAPMSQHGKGVPADLLVVVTDEGKTFHVPGCRFIHDKAHERTMTAAEAARAGYTPCVRCLGKYLRSSQLASAEAHEAETDMADSD